MNRKELFVNIKSKKRLWITICIIFIILTVALAYLTYCLLANFYPELFGKTDKMTGLFTPQRDEIIKDCPDCLRRSIDGVYVEPGQENPYPIAVIIENQVDARPPSGLAQANLVFEVEAEGGITRFLAIYAGNQDLAEIGSIRSARPYLVDWTEEFSALLVHCGGSPEALVKIAKDNALSLNEFYNGGYYWRNKRPGPHNIYTSSELLNKYLESENLNQGKYLSWQYKNDQPVAQSETIDNITIKYKSASYTVNWTYDKDNNDYIRYLAGERHKDIDGEQIKAKNIAIAIIPAEVIDDELRLKMYHIGEGDAIVCLDGQCQEGRWQKKSSSARTRFYKDDGDASTGIALQEFKFNAGTTWIEVVRPEITVDISQ